jgi:ketol-acid reductoisomerase
MKKIDASAKRIAVLGYGSQGRAIALNLRDSGWNVIVGLRRGSKSRNTAHRDKFRQICTISQAVAQADIVCFAFPDHWHGRVFKKEIAKNFTPQSTLWFLHGMSVHFKFVIPPMDSDVILIAPHAPGVTVRENYLTGRLYSAFYAVFQDATGHAHKTTFQLAQAIGLPKRGLISTTFEAEAIGDMFGEQVVLCGGMAALIKNGFDVLIENGIPPENAYLEVAYQLDLIIDLIKKHGIEGMFKQISVSARYGSLVSGPGIIDRSVKERMKKVYREIESGRFPRKLNTLTPSDVLHLNRAVKILSSPALEQAAKKFSK